MKKKFIFDYAAFERGDVEFQFKNKTVINVLSKTTDSKGNVTYIIDKGFGPDGLIEGTDNVYLPQEILTKFRVVRNGNDQGLTPDEHNIHKWGFWRPKGTGRNSPGPLGGIYKLGHGDNEITALIKQDPSFDKVIGEYIAAEIFACLTPKRSARVELISAGTKPDETGENTYIASLFIKGYKGDLFTQFGYEERPMFLGSREVVKKRVGVKTAFRKFMDKVESSTSMRKDFAEIMSVSLLTRNFDVHTGNVGFANGELWRLDYGGALKNLDDKIHSHSRMRHLPGFGATNHFREYPRSLRVSKEMVDSIMDKTSPEATKKLSAAIDKAVDNVAEYYGLDPIFQFAKRTGMPKKEYTDKEELVADLKTFLKEKLKNRQQSLRDFGCEIALDMVLKDPKGYKDKFEQVVADNKEYFEAIAKDPKLIHFRDNKHKGPFKKNLRLKAQEIVKETLAEVDKAPSAPSEVNKETKKVAKEESADLLQKCRDAATMPAFKTAIQVAVDNNVLTELTANPSSTKDVYDYGLVKYTFDRSKPIATLTLKIDPTFSGIIEPQYLGVGEDGKKVYSKGGEVVNGVIKDTLKVNGDKGFKFYEAGVTPGAMVDNPNGRVVSNRGVNIG